MHRPSRRITIHSLFIAALLCAAMSACTPSADDRSAVATEVPVVVIADTGAPTPAPNVANNLVPSDAAVPVASEAPVATPGVSQTTGQALDAAFTYRPVLATVDNAPKARPQTGLMLADIVYEAALDRTENETRFVAVFADRVPASVGPIVSARCYTVLLQKEWDGMYLFDGYPGVENYPALSERDIAILAENTGAAAEHYYTDNTVSSLPEHTLFARANDMAAALYGAHAPIADGRFGFQAGVTYPFGRAIEAVGLPFVGSDMTFVKYTYNPADNLLYRSQRNSKGALTAARTRTPNVDGTDYVTEQIAVQNLIVQYVSYSSLDTVYRTAKLVGSGECDCFINGYHIAAAWRRESEDTPTRYFLKNGEPLILEPGSTWIALHPATRPIRLEYAP